MAKTATRIDSPILHVTMYSVARHLRRLFSCCLFVFVFKIILLAAHCVGVRVSRQPQASAGPLSSAPLCSARCLTSSDHLSTAGDNKLRAAGLGILAPCWPRPALWKVFGHPIGRESGGVLPCLAGPGRGVSTLSGPEPRALSPEL